MATVEHYICDMCGKETTYEGKYEATWERFGYKEEGGILHAVRDYKYVDQCGECFHKIFDLAKKNKK